MKGGLKPWPLTADSPALQFRRAYDRCKMWHPVTGTVDGFDECRQAGQACLKEWLDVASTLIDQAAGAAEHLVRSIAGEYSEEVSLLVPHAFIRLTKVYSIADGLRAAVAVVRAMQQTPDNDLERWSALNALIESVCTQGPCIEYWVAKSTEAARRNERLLR